MADRSGYYLPDELLLNILSNVKERQTLTHIVLVSKRVHSLALPSLYDHVHLDFTIPSHGGLKSFGYICLTKRKLALSVRQFTSRST
jgi:hypothetical protein